MYDKKPPRFWSHASFQFPLKTIFKCKLKLLDCIGYTAKKMFGMYVNCTYYALICRANGMKKASFLPIVGAEMLFVFR